MFLPQTAEYALRAMAQMSALPEGEAVRATDLSKMAGIPEHYLSKILRRLVSHGLLVSEKGHGGGFRLIRPLKKIRFADVFEALGLELDSKRCAFGWAECNAKSPCMLHPAFSQLREAQLRWATRTTLADLIPHG